MRRPTSAELLTPTNDTNGEARIPWDTCQRAGPVPATLTLTIPHHLQLGTAGCYQFLCRILRALAMEADPEGVTARLLPFLSGRRFFIESQESLDILLKSTSADERSTKPA